MASPSDSFPFSPSDWNLEDDDLEQDIDLSDLDRTLRHEMEKILAKRLQLASPTATVTLKFQLNSGEILASAHDHTADFKSIKQELSNKFNAPPDTLAIYYKEREVSDAETPAEVGIAPFSSAELRLESTDPRLELRNSHLVIPTPDIITVHVDDKPLVVEIENRAIRKPYLGGYKNRETGLYYHNASTQTGPATKNAVHSKRFSRDTQTAATTSKATSTWCNAATQSGEPPFLYQKVIQAGEYHSPVRGDREKAVRVIQRNLRATFLRRKVQELSAEYKRRCLAEETEAARQNLQIELKSTQDAKRMACPKTKEDFDVLYAMVDRWRKSQTERIAGLKTEASKKAELCTLLEKELKLLESIEAHRIRAKEEQDKEKAKRILQNAGKPVEWTGYNGFKVKMDTLRTQRARELGKLYEVLGEDASESVRVERLLALKHALAAVDTSTTKELVELVNREAELLTRGANVEKLDFLRRRIQQLFIKYFQEADTQNITEKCHLFCRQCQKMRSRKDFGVSSKDPVATICNFCKTAYGEARTAQDFRHILRGVRRDEQHRQCFSSCAFLISEEDMAFLVGNIWHGRSAVSGVNDIKILRFLRWDLEKDWTPWNCILLTAVEARLHERAGNEQYGERLVQDVSAKHSLAKIHFGHLRSAEARIRDTGVWTNVHEWPMGNDTMKSKMEIDPTTQKDAGYYECQADNQYSIDRRGFRTDYVIYTY